MEINYDKDTDSGKAGWALASITSGEHYRRIIEMYKELGIEIMAEKVDPTTCSGCTRCYAEGNEDIYKIYTKSPAD
jgi:hypothetical protein